MYILRRGGALQAKGLNRAAQAVRGGGGGGGGGGGSVFPEI